MGPSQTLAIFQQSFAFEGSLDLHQLAGTSDTRASTEQFNPSTICQYCLYPLKISEAQLDYDECSRHQVETRAFDGSIALRPCSCQS